MKRTGFLARTAAAFAAIALAIVLTSTAGFAASGFVGKWKRRGHQGQGVHDLALR